MTDKEILSNAIDKAIANGYVMPVIKEVIVSASDKGTTNFITRCFYGVIFSHSFAKAFWGDDPIAITNGKPTVFGSIDAIMPKWVYHLQQMVLEENPIKYLEKFIHKSNDKSFDWKENIVGLDSNLDSENNH